MGTEEATNNANIVKSDPDEKPSPLEQKIIRQVEYYFGDYNLRRDKFLKEEMEHDSGWIPLQTLIKFNRLRQLTEDFSVICEALKKSPNQLMEVNEDNTKVRRTAPLPTSDVNDRDDRTLYVKGFRRDMKLDELLDFFQDHKTENIFMRKRKTGNKLFFKGSVFATFKTQEDCDEFFGKEVKFNKVALHKERKKEYMKRKDEFYDKLRSEKAQKEKEKNADVKKEVENMKAKLKGFEKGCLMKISGLDKTTNKEELKELIEKLGKVAYVDYLLGQEEGVIRFDKPIVAEVLKEAIEEDGVKKVTLGEIKVTVSQIEGDEEDKYFEQILTSRAKSRLRGNNKFSNKGRFNKKNRGKRQNYDNEDNRSSKRPKKEESTNDNTDSTNNHSVKRQANDDDHSSKRVKTENTVNDNTDHADKSSILSPKKETVKTDIKAEVKTEASME